MTVPPKLLDPVKIRIRPIDKAETRYDHVRREPVNAVVRSAEYNIDAQVLWSDPNQIQSNLPIPQEAGVNEQRLGYFLLRVIDLEAAGQLPKRGDSVVKLGDRDCALFVERVTFHDHRGGKFQLAKAYFTERRSEGVNA